MQAVTCCAGRLLLTQRRPVHAVSVGLVGGPIADQGGDLDEGRLVSDSPRLLHSRLDPLQVCVAILQEHSSIKNQRMRRQSLCWGCCGACAALLQVQ